ncbi:hypothetical protein SOVF_160660, partial [Spinacia oleracea]
VPASTASRPRVRNSYQLLSFRFRSLSSSIESQQYQQIKRYNVGKWNEMKGQRSRNWRHY